MPQTIPQGYVPTTAAALDYIARYSDLAHFRADMAWPHFLAYGNAGEGRTWNFTLGATTATVVVTPTPTPGASVIPSTIFGVDIKIVAVGALALYFLTKD